MIACRRVRCGSSVYVQKKWSTDESSGGGALTDDVSGGVFLAAVVATRRWDADVEVIDAMAESTRRNNLRKTCSEHWICGRITAMLIL